MIRESVKKLAEGKSLTARETEGSFSEIMSGKAQPPQIAAFITALRLKGETVTEIASAAKVMRRFARSIDVKTPKKGKKSKRILKDALLDTCGTGGSNINTFNISTTSAFVIAGCGIKVAKHGNRSASGTCGSADVLEALGVNINLAPNRVRRCIRDVGIGFMFAPLFHKAMKYAAPVRKSIGIRTVFNILGPLSNPANADCQILGVYDKSLTEVMAKVLSRLGVKKAFVVHGLDGLDEISITAPTQVAELKGKSVRAYKIQPEQLGFKRARLKDIAGGSPAKNAKLLVSVLNGSKGARRDAVLINAAYGLVAAGKAANVKEALKMARYSIDSGSALEKFYKLRAFA